MRISSLLIGSFLLIQSAFAASPPNIVYILLEEAGYAMGAFGKWGLGFPGLEGDPVKQGFDRFSSYASISDHLSAHWDVFPTLCEIAGVDAPEGLDGISFFPTLLGKRKEQETHEYLFWEFLL